MIGDLTRHEHDFVLGRPDSVGAGRDGITAPGATLYFPDPEKRAAFRISV